jgi:FtsP/CotA-like multicopper oxidase with cupredoxin domain
MALSVILPQTSWAQGQSALENPAPGSSQSGIGFISGWKCRADGITASIDGGGQVPAAYRIVRGDTQSVCGDTNNGFLLQINWNTLSTGSHTVRVFDDGDEFARATFFVTTLGVDFLQGAAGACTVPDFPAAGQSTLLEWEQGLQNFVITSVESGGGGGFPETFTNPPVITSSGGVLTTTFTAAQTEVDIAGQKVQAVVYNGLYIPPTLRIQPGDTTNITIINAFDFPTNLHHHGANVSPQNNSDNIFISIQPSAPPYLQQVFYPPNHQPGMLWYHPHVDGYVESQTFAGMSGAIIVGDILAPFPQLQGIKERVMLLKDFQNVDGQIVGGGGLIDNTGIDSNAGTTRTLNGKVNPTIKIRPGETQFWRIGNVGADIYYRLKLDGHTLYELARGGNRHTELVPQEEIVLPPGDRTEVLVRGGAPGMYQFRTLYYNQGDDGDQYPEVTLGTLISEGPAETPVALPTKDQFPAVQDLRTQPIAQQRTMTFSENPDTGQFYINSLQFDATQVNYKPVLGTIEEWTLQNVANEEHVFHIHQLDFQVTEINGQAVPFVGHQDIVNLPVGSTVKVLIPFTDPAIVGKFVFHCHILAHEDLGMMLTVQVDPPAN